MQRSETLFTLRWLSGNMSRAEFAELCCTTEQTVRRWERGGHALAELIAIHYCAGFIETHDDWTGWRVDRCSGELISPDTGERWKIGEIRATHWLRQRLSHYEREIKRLKLALELEKQSRGPGSARPANDYLY